MTLLHYFRSASTADLGAFTDDPSGAKLPEEGGPWRLERSVDPGAGWTEAVDLSAARAGIYENGFFLVDGVTDLSFGAISVRPGD